MQFESRVAVISFLCGVLVVVSIATGQYYLFDYPLVHDLYVRAVILVVFTAFGILLQRALMKKLAAENELKRKLKETVMLNEIMERREHRIVEVKQEVNALLVEMGRGPKYGV